ncbi:MAG: Asp-tRNA(Asn)/Glu-tRNA(Gln) amidotransferase subunit GatC [Firmicutes bacterium]|nr:Asp-tRNA(Asn)/Glu-tRNA(Gln) amidotransferase subunit GatC [Bacillota bacterium]
MSKSIIDKKVVEHVAGLACLELDEEEKNRMTYQLNSILDYITVLQPIDTSGIEATFQVLPVNNVFREDESLPSLPAEEVLANSPGRENDLFKMPKIMEIE